MRVFMDESGDVGMDVAHGASTLFTVVLVLFRETEEAQAVDNRTSLLRCELIKSASFEFHFQENSDYIRKKFLEAVSSYDFSYFGFVINKTKFSKESLPTSAAFYQYVCGLIFENAKPYLNKAIVKIDASGGRKFQRQLAAYLKAKINLPDADIRYLDKVSSESSSANNLLQLADMVCGAVARSYRPDKKSPDVFRKIIKHREISVQLFPE